MSPPGKLTATFFGASVMAFAIVGGIAVSMGHYDPRISPQAALVGEFGAGALFTVIGTTVLGAAAFWLHKRLLADRSAIRMTIAWGLAYAALWRCMAYATEALDAADSVAAAVLAWLYLLGFPLLLYWPLARIRSLKKEMG